jgi:hypothetical protein
LVLVAILTRSRILGATSPITEGATRLFEFSSNSFFKALVEVFLSPKIFTNFNFRTFFPGARRQFDKLDAVSN